MQHFAELLRQSAAKSRTQRHEPQTIAITHGEQLKTYWISSPGQTTGGGPPANSTPLYQASTAQHVTRLELRTDSWERKFDTRLGTWTARMVLRMKRLW